VLNNASAKMYGTTIFYIRVLHMEGEEVFGSQNRKLDMPLGDEQQSSKLYLSISWNKVLSSLNCWLFFDQHTGGVLFQPLGNGCNSSCTRQTANLHWHPITTSCYWCLGKSQQLYVYYNSKGLHLTSNNDSTPRIWMHHYFRFGNCANH
jgi:hypothetical protein